MKEFYWYSQGKSLESFPWISAPNSKKNLEQWSENFLRKIPKKKKTLIPREIFRAIFGESLERPLFSWAPGDMFRAMTKVLRPLWKCPLRIAWNNLRMKTKKIWEFLGRTLDEIGKEMFE